MPPRTAAPQVPGAPAVNNEPETVDQPAADTGETVSVPKAQLDALLSRVAALESSGNKAAERRANPEAHLPDQDAVDPAKITTPQLTKQGWVVPANFGANPAAKQV